MTPGPTVGDFSRITHLSVKTLRHYHQVGLLEPATVNPGTGYRYYGADQVPTAQVIRRLRDLEMPVAAVDSLRNLLSPADAVAIEHRSVPATPAAELAIISHLAPMDDADLSYAKLGSYAATHEISIDGLLREYYLRGASDTADQAEWRTEIGWPIFRADGSA